MRVYIDIVMLIFVIFLMSIGFYYVFTETNWKEKAVEKLTGNISYVKKDTENRNKTRLANIPIVEISSDKRIDPEKSIKVLQELNKNIKKTNSGILNYENSSM